MKKDIKFNIFIYVIIFCFCLSIFILNIFSKKVLPIFMNYATSQIKTKSVSLINNVVNKHISNISDLNKLIIITKDSNGDIQMIDYDSAFVSKTLNSIISDLILNLKDSENGMYSFFDNYNVDKFSNIYEIPLGAMSNNIFLGNFGPKIPVKLNIVGDVLANIDTEVKEYGINNALVETSINISVTERVIIPFVSENINISLSIPVSLKLIQGNIPIYYGNAFERKSNILSTPTE